MRPTFGIYIATNVYPDTFDQCASYLVPISTAISYASQCINVFTGDGQANSSYNIQCNNDTSYTLNSWEVAGCSPGSSSASTKPLSNVCTLTNNPVPNVNTPGSFNVIQSCQPGATPTPVPNQPTMTINEYATPYCNNGFPDSTTLVSTTTSILNVCQNTGGTTSFQIQCNSSLAYMSYYSGYGCLPTSINNIIPLFQIGCSSSTTSVVVSCTSGTTPSPLPPPSPLNHQTTSGRSSRKAPTSSMALQFVLVSSAVASLFASASVCAVDVTERTATSDLLLLLPTIPLYSLMRS